MTRLLIATNYRASQAAPPCVARRPLAHSVLPRPSGNVRTSVRVAAAQRTDGPRWELSALNPVIGVEHPPKAFADGKRGPAIWNDPSVLVEADGYSMWASVGHGGPQGVAIYKLRSSDGERWEVQNGGRPVLEPGGKSDFDSLGVETPAVIKAGDVYHMYYSAYPHGKLPLVTIGHAVSPDGVKWTKRGELTSLTKIVGQNNGNPWGWLGRGEPTAVYDRGTFFLYFSDVHCRQNDCKGSPAAMRGISLATSTDGQTFEQRGREPIVQASGFVSRVGGMGRLFNAVGPDSRRCLRALLRCIPDGRQGIHSNIARAHAE